MGASAVLGSAFHYAMEVYSGGSDTLLVSNEAEAIECGLKAGMDYLDKYNDGFINWSKTIPNKQKLFDLLTFLFRSYVEQNTWQDNIIAVEKEIKRTIDIEWKGQQLSLPVPLKGFIDKIYREDGKLKIKDYKTCYAYSNPEKIDGAKMLQAVTYYLLAYAEYGEEPHSVTFEEVKYTKNSDGTPQVRQYEMVFADNELYFDFFFRFYEDMTKALNGEMVYVPNVNAMYDNEVSIVAYIHRLDIAEEQAALMKKHKVTNVTDLLKKEIQSAGNMRKLMKAVEDQFVSAKNIDYSTMKNEERIQTKMMEHGMMLQFHSVIEGSTVDLYRFTPSIGIKMSKVTGYVADVEQVLGVTGVRVLAPIPSTTFVGFEVPRAVRTFPSPAEQDGFNIAIGETIDGHVRRFDIREAPHMLVAGSSGSGKSVFLNAIIPQLAKVGDIHLFDPKIVELVQFKELAEEYKTDSIDIMTSLVALVGLMERRYKELSNLGKRNIAGTQMSYKFVIIDEFGDLAISNSELTNIILRLAQKGRAAGIHLIIATQRPSVDVINGTVKANFPTKVVFKTAKEVDSRVVLDEKGAEKLLGKGDMLFAGDNGIERLQGYNA